MSTLKVNAISDAAGANGNAITLATDGTCTAKIKNRSSNLIVNGAMNIAQRGTSSTSKYYKTCDRWSIGWAGEDEAITQAQVDVAADTDPWNKGFRKALQLTNGNQTSGAGAGDILQILYKIEAQDIANSGWDYTSASSYITYSFWVKSSVAQNFNGRINTPDGTGQNYHFQTGSLSANTWTKITKTIPGNSNITVNNDTGEGFRIYLYPFAGTDNTESITLNQWSTNTTCGPDMTSTWWTTNDSTIAITGVQLEVGDYASDYCHEPYTETLLKCQRYFQFIDGLSDQLVIAYGRGNGTTLCEASIPLTVPLRASPSITCSSNTQWNADNASNTSTTPTVRKWSLYATALACAFSGHVNVVNSRCLVITGSSGANFEMDAEL